MGLDIDTFLSTNNFTEWIVNAFDWEDYNPQISWHDLHYLWLEKMEKPLPKRRCYKEQ